MPAPPAGAPPAGAPPAGAPPLLGLPLKPMPPFDAPALSPAPEVPLLLPMPELPPEPESAKMELAEPPEAKSALLSAGLPQATAPSSTAATMEKRAAIGEQTTCMDRPCLDSLRAGFGSGMRLRNYGQNDARRLSDLTEK